MKKRDKIIDVIVRFGLPVFLLVVFFFMLFRATAQTDLLPTVAWRTYVSNVEQLTDSTYKFEVFPQDWNEPGATSMDYGNYFVDYGGNIYEVIDSAYLSVTVYDIFERGVSPQVGRIGVMYNSAYLDYLTPVNYTYLDKTAMDAVRAIELHKIGQMLKRHDEYINDSLQLISDTLFWDATKYDLDTLHIKLLDSLFIHRSEIDLLTNKTDSIDNSLPQFSTTLQTLTGTNSETIITPLRLFEAIEMLSIQPYGETDDLYMDGRKITADSLIIKAIRATCGQVELLGNLHVEDTIKVSKLQFINDYPEGYYLRIGEDGDVVVSQISGAMIYKGTWNAETNTPTLTDGTGTNGWYYRVVVGDTIDLGGGDIIFLAGDDVIYNGATWERIPNDIYIPTIATATDLGVVKIGANIDVTAGGTISTHARQNISTTGALGNITISNGSTINLNIGDPSSVNELQDISIENDTIRITLKNSYVSLTYLVDSINSAHTRIDGLNVVLNDTVSYLFDYVELSKDSLRNEIDTLSTNIYTFVGALRSDINDSLLVHHNRIKALELLDIVEFSDTIITIATKTDVFNLQGEINDSLQSHHLRLVNIGDILIVHRDSLNSYDLRLISIENLDIAEIADLSGLRDSTSAIYDTLAVHLDTLHAHNLRILDVKNMLSDSTNYILGIISDSTQYLINILNDTTFQIRSELSDSTSYLRTLIQDSIFQIREDYDYLHLIVDQRLDIIEDSIISYDLRLLDLEGIDYNSFLTGIRDTLSLHSDSLSVAYDSIYIFSDTLISHNFRLIELENIDYNPFMLKESFSDSLFQYILTDFDSTGFKVTESQISDLQPYLLQSDLSNINDSLAAHNLRLIEIEGYDTTGIYHENRAILDAIDETWNAFYEWDKDYFDLINRPNIVDSIKFYIGDSISVIYNSVDTLTTSVYDSLFAHNIRIVDLESFTESDPIYSVDSAYIKTEIRNWLNFNKDYNKLINQPDIIDSIIYYIGDSIAVVYDSLINYDLRLMDLETFEINPYIDSLRFEIDTVWQAIPTDYLTGADTIYLNSKVIELIDTANVHNLRLLEIEGDTAYWNAKVEQQQLADTTDYLRDLITDSELAAATTLQTLTGTINTVYVTPQKMLEVLQMLTFQNYGQTDDVYAPDIKLTIDSLKTGLTAGAARIDSTGKLISVAESIDFTGDIDGVNFAYVLTKAPTELFIYLNGIYQIEGVQFTLSGENIIFTEAPRAGDYLTIKYK